MKKEKKKEKAKKGCLFYVPEYDLYVVQPGKVWYVKGTKGRYVRTVSYQHLDDIVTKGGMRQSAICLSTA